MVKIGLKDAYYKLEDKWFGFIDWADKKGIPSYSFIDPLEKRGIPSLPVYIAILLIILYLALPMIGLTEPPAPPPEEYADVPISVFDSNTGDYLDGAIVEARLDDEFYASAQTGPAGTVDLSLERGNTYQIIAETEDCEEASIVYEVPLEGEPTQQDFSLEDCGYGFTDDETEICFTPSGIGTVSYEKIEPFSGIVEETAQCEGEVCGIELEEGYNYRFDTAEYESEGSYSKEELEAGEGEECIPMEKKDDNQPPPNYGDVTITVRDEKGEPLGGRTVQLVYPESPDNLIAEGTTSDQEGSIGRASFSQQIETEFYIKVLSGDGTGAKLYNETIYAFTKHHQELEVIVERYEDTPIKIIREEDGEALEGASLRIFKDGEEHYIGETDSNGDADPVPNLETETYQLSIFKEDYEPLTGLEITGGEAHTFQLRELGEHESADLRVEVREDTEEKIRVEEAQVDIKTQEEEHPIGETKKTNRLGRVTFESIPGGNYCVEVRYREKTYACGNHPITIDPEQESLAERTILIDPLWRNLEINVTRNGEGVEEAQVEGYDKHGRRYGPTQTDSYGLTDFDRVPDGRTVTVRVDKDIEGEIYRPSKTVKVDSDKTINFNLDEPLEREIELDRVIEQSTGDEFEPNQDNLDTNRIYEAKFQIDLKNYTERETWDEITSNIWTDNELNLYPVPEADKTGWNTGERGKTQELTILGPEYEEAGNEPEFTVPFIVQPTAEEEINVNYQASWEKDETYIQTDEKEFSFEINRGEGSREGQFFVERCVDVGDGCENQQDAGKANPKDRVTAMYFITNLEDTFTGEMNFQIPTENAEIIGEHETDPEEPDYIKITKPTGETEYLDFTVENNTLSFILDEDTPFEQNDELAVEIVTDPWYPAAEVIIEGTAEETPLQTIKYETGGKIPTSLIFDEGSRYSVSKSIDMTIMDTERGRSLTEEQLKAVKEQSKITGDLEGCSEIDLSERGRTEITQGEEGNILRVNLDRECHLKPGHIEVHLEGGDIDSRTKRVSIGPTLELGPKLSTEIDPGESCSINVIKQGIGIVEGVETSMLAGECSEDTPSAMRQIVIEYPEEVISSGDIEVHSLEMSSDTIEDRFLDGYVKAEIAGDSIIIETTEEMQEGVIDLALTSVIEANNEGITEKQRNTIDISITKPATELGGNRFQRQAIQSYGAEEYSCSDRYCSLEQALEFALRAPERQTQVRLVDTGTITPSDVQTTLQEHPYFGDVPVTQGHPAEIDFGDYEGEEELIIVSDDTEDMPGIGDNVATVDNGTVGDLDYYYLSFEHYPREESYLVEGLGLWMPHTELGTGRLKEISATPIYIDETVTNRGVIEDEITSALEEMWGISQYPSDLIYGSNQHEQFKDNHRHGIHIGICPEDDLEHDNCERIEKRGYPSSEPVIFRGYLDSKIYVHAPNEETLKNLSERFNLAFGMQRSGMALHMLNPAIRSEGALTLAPQELTYYCWSQGQGTTCPGGESTLDLIREVGELQTGITGPIELKQEESLIEVLEDDSLYVDWVIASVDNERDLKETGEVVVDPRSGETMTENHYIHYYINMFGQGVSADKVRLPPEGILYQHGPTTLLVPRGKENNIPTLINRFKRRLGEGGD